MKNTISFKMYTMSNNYNSYRKLGQLLLISALIVYVFLAISILLE
jgi:hypothetical protein